MSMHVHVYVPTRLLYMYIDFVPTLHYTDRYCKTFYSGLVMISKVDMAYH